MTTHLDLGCGMQPRNPYGCETLFGVDVMDGVADQPGHFYYKRANLSLERIPFRDGAFDSVSAFDFIEHIPRQLAVDGAIRLPFIELMNEVHRVLKPGGLFYAVTPAYPAPEAFQDPTHVNIITEGTAAYFEPKGYARNYGFTGAFRIRRHEWTDSKNALTPGRSFRKTLRAWHRRITKGPPAYLLWELEALK